MSGVMRSLVEMIIVFIFISSPGLLPFPINERPSFFLVEACICCTYLKTCDLDMPQKTMSLEGAKVKANHADFWQNLG